MKIREMAIVLGLVGLFPISGQALECPEPSTPIGQDVKGEIEGKANFLLRFLGEAGLQGAIDVTQKDFYHKYPNAAQLAVDQTFIVIVCTGLRDDPALSESEKTNRLIEFRKGFVYRKQEVKREIEQDPYRYHSYETGSVPNGYYCQADRDCAPSPAKRYCYPGPPNNEAHYCQHGSNNCAFPGTAGTRYKTRHSYKGRTYECYNPKTGDRARWRLVP